MTDRDLCLKGADEQALIEALPFARGADKDGSPHWIESTHDFSLIIQGTLYNNDEVFSETEVDVNGVPVIISPKTKIVGFHANILVMNDDIVIPAEIIVTPSNRQLIWAGRG